MNRTNLEKLATYLESLPADYAHFRMQTFYCLNGRYQEKPASITAPVGDCGTVACAVGHGIAAGIPALPGECWHGYGFRAFLGEAKPSQRKYHNRLFLLLFSGLWADHDNTIQGAAGRIRWVLAAPNRLVRLRARELMYEMGKRDSQPVLAFIKEYAK